MDVRLRSWITAIAQRRSGLLAIALQQRAKFEHWLKFELAETAISNGATSVEIEPAGTGEGAGIRGDVAFTYEGNRYHVELKTPNTNWRMPGVWQLTRPITKNIAEIVADGRKPPLADAERIIAFAMFPVPPSDDRWHAYLDRVSEGLAIPLTEAKNASRVDVILPDGHHAELVIVTFKVPRTAPLSIAGGTPLT